MCNNGPMAQPRIGRWGALLVSIGLGAGACATLLGDDFTIGEATTSTTTSGGGSGAQGGGGSGGAGGAGGGGGALTPWTCDWQPQSIHLVHSLAADPMPQWNGGFEAVSGDHQVRAFLPHGTPNGPIVDLFSISDSNDHQAQIPGQSVLQARRVGNDRVSAMTYVQNGGLTQVFLTAVLDNNDDGSMAQTQQIMEVAGPQLIAGSFAPIAVGDVTFVVTQDNGGIEEANLGHWQGTAVSPTNFDRDTNGNLANGDYRVGNMLRDAAGMNHVFLGSIFDGGSKTRHFVVPDQPSPNTTPVAEFEDLLISLQHRPTGDYIAAYGVITNEMTFDLRMGPITEDELATHTAADVPLAGNLGTLTSIPTEGDQFVTNESLVILGKRATTPDQLSIILARIGGVVLVADLPFPDPSIFPSGWTFNRIQVVVLDSLFDMVGGSISVVWTINVNGDYDELYYGELFCAPEAG
jgi:hypothetical protein